MAQVDLSDVMKLIADLNAERTDFVVLKDMLSRADIHFDEPLNKLFLEVEVSPYTWITFNFNESGELTSIEK